MRPKVSPRSSRSQWAWSSSDNTGIPQGSVAGAGHGRALGPGLGGRTAVGSGRRSDDAGGMSRYVVPAGAVVVGVDGSEDAGRAVSWAAHQAVLERRTLAIVHSTDQLALRDTGWLDVQGIDHAELVNPLGPAGQATLAASRARAAAAAPGVEVVTAVVEDDARIALT